MSMFEWLTRMISILENAGLSPAEVAIAISPLQERVLLEELFKNSGVHVQTCHHSEYAGWRIIVKGKQ